MAATMLFRSCFLIFLTVILFSSSTNGVSLRGGMMGGWTEIQDLKSNHEVQELGRFSVEQFNMKKQEHGDNSGDLTFLEVLEARRQVVSGLKYSLKIAAYENGYPKEFDAIVVVKPWIHSKTLLDFAPLSAMAPTAY